MRWITLPLAIAAALLAQEQSSLPAAVARLKALMDDAKPGAHRKIEQALVEAVDLWRREPGANRAEHAEVAVLLAAVRIGAGQTGPEVTALLNEALAAYAAATPAVAGAPLALALETMAAALEAARQPAAAERDGAAAIRRAAIAERSKADDHGKPRLDHVEKLNTDTTERPTILVKGEPLYTNAARLAKRQGGVVVSFVVDTDGTPRDVALVQSLGFGLDEAAYDAVRTWRFKPATRNGAPVPVVANVEVNFRLL